MTNIWEGVRSLRDEGGVTEEKMGEVVPRGRRDRAFRPEEVSPSGNSDREVLAAHGAETTNSHKALKKLNHKINIELTHFGAGKRHMKFEPRTTATVDHHTR